MEPSQASVMPLFPQREFEEKVAQLDAELELDAVVQAMTMQKPWLSSQGRIAPNCAEDYGQNQAMPSAKANELLNLDIRSPDFESESTKDLPGWQHLNHHNFVGHYADGNEIGEEPKEKDSHDGDDYSKDDGGYHHAKGEDSHGDVESEDSHPQKPIGAQQQTRHR